jgi:putative ABC transport system permease protein
MFGILSLLGVQAILCSRRLLAFRLAWQQLNRKKRQAALLMAGLMIGSAIISSSLIVGDSLDQTVREEVDAAWGDTDLLISGFDANAGQVTEIPLSVVDDLRSSGIQDIDYIQSGRVLSTSVVTAEGKANPSVAWFAFEHQDGERIGSKEKGLTWFELEEVNRFATTPQVVVNTAFSDELAVREGEEIQLGWFVRTQDGIERVEENFTIHQIVAMSGQGQLAGTTTPALFTDLATAQEWQQSEGNVTSIRISLDGETETRTAINPAIDAVIETLNNSIGVDESGLQLISEQSAVTLASTNGLGRLSPQIVTSLVENRSTLTPESTLMEVLQVPLVGLESQTSNLLTLADGDIDDLRIENGTLWHWGPAGIGFETNDTSWVWRVPSGDIVNDVSVNDGYGFAAYGEGLIVGNVSTEDTKEVLEEQTIVAVSSNSSTWIALESGESTSIWFGDLSNDSAENVELTLTIPSTVLDWELEQDENFLYLRIESLLSELYYRQPLEARVDSFTEISSSQWPFSSPSSPDVCNGVGAEFNATHAWCIEETGLVLRFVGDGSFVGMRLPILSDAGGFGTLPQMFFALDGDVSDLRVRQGDVHIGERLEPLSSIENSTLVTTGLFQYAFGSDESVNLTINGSFVDDDRLSSLTDLDPVILGLINMSDAELLAVADESERSMLVFGNVSSQNLSALEQHLDSLVGMDDLSLSVRAVKLDALEQAEASSGVLSAMFLVFGSFTIAAGILLIITIVTMMIDVRQKEYATVRALGMTRSDLRYTTLVEGSIAATVGCAIGSLIGVGLAWVIGIGFSTVFANAGADVFSFHVDISSLLAGWFWGFHIAMMTLYGSALWSSRMIIVHALKNVPQRVPKHVPWGLYLFIIGALALVLFSTGFFFIGGDLLAHSAWIILGCAVVLFICPILFWIVPVFRAKRTPEGSLPTYREAPRRTIGFIGVLLLVWTGLPSWIDPVRSGLTPNEFSFIIIGLVQVFAGVLVLAALAPLMIRSALRLASFKSGAVVPVALSYPLHKPLRTAVVMGMFSITVFSVIVLSGYTLQFENYSSNFVEESEGEFELMLSSARSRPLQLESPVSEWDLQNTDVNQIDAVGRVYRAQAFIENNEGERSPYILRGVDRDFSEHGGLPLHLWDSSLGQSSEEAWLNMQKQGDVVFVDASFGLESSLDGTNVGIFALKVGENITIIDSQQPSHRREVMVGGILEQSSYLFSAGIWMPSEPVLEQYDGSLTRVYVSVSDNAQPSPDFDTDEVRYFSAAGKTSSEREAATELAERLRLDLEKDGVDVSLIAEDVALIQALVLSILALFEGYLAIGLMIGIAGIGVVTYRSVSERRKHIGMLRALGFTRGMVARVHLIEVGWVSLLGIINGIVVGLMFHVGLHSAIWESEGADLVLPWTTVFWVFFGGVFLVYLATLIPVRAVSKIQPSEALRSMV